MACLGVKPGLARWKVTDESIELWQHPIPNFYSVVVKLSGVKPDLSLTNKHIYHLHRKMKIIVFKTEQRCEASKKFGRHLPSSHGHLIRRNEMAKKFVLVQNV